MLTLLCGEAKSGKTAAIFSQMAHLAEAEERSLLIVPENASHDTERQLLSVCGNGVGRFARVTTFSKLTEEVLRAVGKQVTSLDAGGKVLQLYRALCSVQGQLRYFRNKRRQDMLLAQLMQTVDELLVCRVAPTQLLAAAHEEQSGKLQDLALIYAAYQHLCHTGTLDPHDRTELAAQYIAQSGLFDGLHIFIDHFSGFTAQKYHAIEGLLKAAKNMTIALFLGEDRLLFSEQYKTKQRLQRLAADCQCPCVTEQRETAQGMLWQAVFSHVPLTRTPTQDISCIRAQHVAQECTFAAAQMRQWLLRDGVRARNIAVACPDTDGYLQTLEHACARYGVPLFTGEKDDILQRPVLQALLGALEAVDDGLAVEGVFSYLKAGLSGIARDACDRLENYALLWNIAGRQWDEPFVRSTAGYRAPPSDEEARLQGLNDARAQLCAQLLPLKRDLRACSTGEQYAKAAEAHLVRIGFSDALSARIEQLQQTGQARLAAQYAQLYDILCDALRQFGGAMQGQEMDLSTFVRLLRLQLGQYALSTIPPSLDSVTASSFTRLYHHDTQYLIVLGAREGLFPSAEAGGSLLSQHERVALEGAGIVLTQNDEQRAFEQLSTIYRTLQSTGRTVMIIAPQMMPGGEPASDSSLVERLQMLHPIPWQSAEEALQTIGLSAPAAALEAACSALDGEHEPTAAAKAALQYLQEHGKGDFFVRLQSRRTAPNQPIKDRALLAQLYGKQLNLSASRLEQLSSCRFCYFMQYGLRAQVREQAQFGAPQIGTFVHFVIERAVAQLCKQRPQEAAHADEAARTLAIEQAIAEAVEAGVGQYLETMRTQYEQTARFAALLRSFTRHIVDIVRDIYEEIMAGAFTPSFFELSFGSHGDFAPLQMEHGDITLRISGSIDRVDAYVQDGQLYWKVVDYKTGKKRFALSDVLHGLNLQMFIYLAMIKQQTPALLKALPPSLADRVSDAAGCAALYIPTNNPVVPLARGEGAAKVQKDRQKLRRRIGLLPAEMPLIEALEHRVGEYRFLPLRVRKDGTLTGGNVADAEQMARLLRHTERCMHRVAEQIISGDVAANPYQIGPEVRSCRWCNFPDACQFEPDSARAQMRHLQSYSEQEVHQILKEEEADAHGIFTDQAATTSD